MTDTAAPITSPPKKVGILGYILAFVLLLVSVAWLGGYGWYTFAHFNDGLQHVVFEGDHAEADMKFDKAGTQTVFYERSTTVNGEKIANDNAIDSLKLAVSGPDNDEVEIDNSVAEQNYNMGGHNGTGVFKFDVKDTGTYRLTAEQDGDDKYVLGVGDSPVDDAFLALGVWLGVTGMLGVLCLAAFIVTIVRRSKAKRLQKKYEREVGSQA